MQPVSVYESKNPLVIRSEYYNIKPVSFRNTHLKVQCNVIPTFMALADISRDDRTKANLKEKFYQALSMCQNEEDLAHLNEFLKEAASKGGYAETFYLEFSKYISMQGIEFSKKIIDKIEENRKRPISLNKNGRVESPYLSVMKVQSANIKFSLTASSIPMFMALTDISRDAKSMEILKIRVYRALSLCESLEDVKKLEMLLKSLENKGGIAMSFCPTMYKYMNLQGIQHAKTEFATHEYKKEEAKSVEMDQKDELEEFLEDYKKASNLLDQIRENSMLNEEKISVLRIYFDNILAKYHYLPADVKTAEIKNLEYEIQEKMDWLHGASSVFDEEREILSNLR